MIGSQEEGRTCCSSSPAARSWHPMVASQNCGGRANKFHIFETEDNPIPCMPHTNQSINHSSLLVNTLRLSYLIARHLVGHVGAHEDADLRGRGAHPLPDDLGDEHGLAVSKVEAL